MSNKGIYSPKDTKFLMDMQQFPRLGQLELIQSINVASAVSTVSFNGLGDNKYDVLFVTCMNVTPSNDNKHLRLRVKVDGATQSGSNYDQEMNRHIVSSVSNLKAQNATQIYLGYNIGTGTGETTNNYHYIYQANNPLKYTFITLHSSSINYTPYSQLMYGGGQYKVQAKVDGLEYSFSGNDIAVGSKFSLYGIRFS